MVNPKDTLVTWDSAAVDGAGTWDPADPGTIERQVDSLEGEISAVGSSIDRPVSTAARSVILDEMDPEARYERVGRLGQGGIGDVWQVWDHQLRRPIAMKTLRAERAGTTDNQLRFVEEAQVTAQLQHPGVVPVYELGRREDGQPFFMMKEVHGWTLGEAIRCVHAASTPQGWGQATLQRKEPTAQSDWTLRRLLGAFVRICETMAYAHIRGVVHRDLKPANLMVGAYGEVYVMDWGLAKLLVGHDPAPVEGSPPPRSASSTQDGVVLGTPYYMAPEQAQGRVSVIGPAADVYALGAILCEILSGSPPFGDLPSPVEVVAAVRTRGPVVTLSADKPAVDGDLVAITQRALSHEPADRYQEAGALGRAVQDWLDGAQRRDQGLAIVADATAELPELDRRRQHAASLRRAALAKEEATRPHDAVEHKREAWRLRDEAQRAATDLIGQETRWLQKVWSALQLVGELPEAHDLLARHHAARLLEAERRGDQAAGVREEALLRSHDRGQHARLLGGAGVITLHTDPVGANVELWRYEEQDRRLVPVLDRVLGETPLIEVEVPQGSMLLRIIAEGRAPVSYPVHVGRLEHWHGCAPGQDEPTPVRLLTPEELGGGCYVPAGWAWTGGRGQRAQGSAHRWVEGFVIQPVCIDNQTLLRFINHLVAEGRSAEAAAVTPAGDHPSGLYSWAPKLPARRLTHAAAVQLATWLGGEHDRAWRLPTEWEWEKASRGVDGRSLPWGDHRDPTWSVFGDSTANGGHLVAVDGAPQDLSVYGAMGMAGNVREWTSTAFDVDQPDGALVAKGACWLDLGPATLLPSRHPLERSASDDRVGLRLVWSVT